MQNDRKKNKTYVMKWYLFLCSTIHLNSEEINQNVYIKISYPLFSKSIILFNIFVNSFVNISI